MRGLLLALCLLPLPGAAQEAVARFGTGATPVVIRSTTDIGIIAPALEAFLRDNPDLSITYEQWGSNALYAQASDACAGQAPQADVVFSSAAHHMVGLVNAGCALPHRSDLTAALPPSRRWRDELWGVTEEPAVILYNRDLVPEAEVPDSRFALLDLMRTRSEDWRGRIATYDIEDSGLGYLFAFSDSLEAETFGGLLEGFARTGAVATCCSAEIIAAVADGRFLIAYNVLGSYVQSAGVANIGVVLPRDYTLFLTRAYMIPRGAAQPQAAARLLDFLLSPRGQALLSAAGLVYPAQGPEDAPGSRRFIALTPALLVALDRSSADRFGAFWKDAFLGLND